jgi:endonuclease III
MKNATKHAEELKSLIRKLIKEHKPAAKQVMEPLKALVRGAMSFDVSDARADEAMKAIDKEFCDLNELRVATDLEIQELLGTRYPQIEKRVAMITLSLNAIFEKEHTLNLDRLKTVSKKDVRAFLRDLPEIHPFVEAYVMLYGFDSPAVPVDDDILAYLKDQGVIEDGSTLEEAQKFMEHHLKADEMYEAYAALRRAVHDEAGKGKKKTTKA